MFVEWIWESNLLPDKADPTSPSCSGEGPRGSSVGLQTRTKPCCPSEWAWVWEVSGFFCDSSSCCRRQLALKKSCHELGLALPAAFNTAHAYLPGHIRVPRPTDYTAKHGTLFSCWGISSSVCPFFFLLVSSGPEALWGCAERDMGEMLSSLHEQDEPSTMSIWTLKQISRNLKFISGCWKRTSCANDV